MKAPRRRSKYGAVPTVVDGIRFASKAEAARYRQLRQMQTLGIIESLVTHPVYAITIHGTDCAKYIADFRYFRDGMLVVEDVKGVQTDVFKLKRKLVEALYPGVHIKIVKGRR